MCGIAGVFNTFSRPLEHVPAETYQKITNALSHRGPDDEGDYTDSEIWLGFRRLSIIDLSGGQQPLFNETKSVVCVCNGEIFNYRELRAGLISRGHVFRSNCDVEVLVHLYEEKGFDMFRELNGQFVFALYDKERQRLLVARDHVGICPLFYTLKDDKIVFASEIKSILNYPGIERKVNLEGIDQIFCLPGLCSPVTMFKNIHALRPGHFLLIEHGEVMEKEYWDLDFPTEELPPLPEEQYIEQLHEHLVNSVQYRLNADVPVGLYISGGLDSCILAGISKSLNHVESRDSFGIVFDQGAYDERHYQRAVTKFSNTTHHEIRFDVNDIASKLSDMVYCAESPLKETYNTCSLALSQKVRQQGLKVVLTGEGADEIFAGYVGYRLDKQRNNLRSELTDIEQVFEAELREKIWGDAEFQYEKNLFPYQEVRRGIYSEGLNQLFDDFTCLNDRLIDKKKIKGRSKLKKRSYLDFKLRLSDHLLADHGDRVCYANSIEGRYPYLDINLIKFSQTIPDDLKLNDQSEKYILRKTFKKYGPPEIFNREKFGFVAPGAKFLLKQNIDWINDLLSYDRIKRQGFFDPDAIERLKRVYRQEQFSLSETFEVDVLMIVVTFQLFIDLFNMPDFT